MTTHRILAHTIPIADTITSDNFPGAPTHIHNAISHALTLAINETLTNAALGNIIDMSDYWNA